MTDQLVGSLVALRGAACLEEESADSAPMTRRAPPPLWQTPRQALAAAKAEIHRLSVKPRVVIRSPPNMDIGGMTLGPTLAFLRDIRKEVFETEQDVTMDLRGLRRISPAATLLLAAEIGRCNSFRPRSVWGIAPAAEDPQIVLAALGFHDAVGSPHPASLDEWEGVARIQTGTSNPADTARKLGQVAALARENWDDAAFCDRVHGALNEAMTNVIMHAYDLELEPNLKSKAVMGSWWIAGLADPGTDHVWFMALDHGIGIPVSAPARHAGIKAYLAQLPKSSDEQVLYSIITQEGRSRTGLPQHGKGIPAMVSLIKDRAEEGTIWIFSGLGGYLLDKRRATSTSPGRIYELPFTLPVPLAGTLILWKVGRPISISEAVVSA